MTIEVAGHGLPTALAQAIGSGTWPASVPDGTLEAIFHRELYTLAEMVGVTTHRQPETDPACLGTADDNLDPTRSILIGDLGVDRPFGLDLRTTPPSVRFLRIDGRWVRVA